jgi:hypothetical protein
LFNGLEVEAISRIHEEGRESCKTALVRVAHREEEQQVEEKKKDGTRRSIGTVDGVGRRRRSGVGYGVRRKKKKAMV